MGIFANYIYMQQMEKQAYHAKTMSEPYKSQFIEKNGGVNTTALVLSIVGWSILMLIVLFA